MLATLLLTIIIFLPLALLFLLGSFVFVVFRERNLPAEEKERRRQLRFGDKKKFRIFRMLLVVRLAIFGVLAGIVIVSLLQAREKYEKQFEPLDVPQVEQEQQQTVVVAQKNPVYSPEEAQAIIENRAKEVVQALKEKDMQALASFMHPEEPLRFWSINAQFELPKENVASFFVDQTEHTGSTDGSGLPFTFTQAEYYERSIYDRDYLNAPEVSYELRFYSSATTSGPQFERYYEEDPIAVTYAFPQSSPDAAFDWRNLRLWFIEENGVWYLREIMHNQWAI